MRVSARSVKLLLGEVNRDANKRGFFQRKLIAWQGLDNFLSLREIGGVVKDVALCVSDR